MKAYLTFDYELFFGPNSGTLESCMIVPTNELLDIADNSDQKLVFFVDAGYVNSLKINSSKNNSLRRDYTKVSRQLDQILEKGHDIQLHIHPHWEDSIWKNGNWYFDTSRYKLSDFSHEDVVEICRTYKGALSQYTNESDIFAYRAGGWCIQPFEKIRKGLLASGVWLDSTIYHEGLNLSEQKGFDFRGAPSKDIWRFDKDPLIEAKDGPFVELAISSTIVSPLVYWRILLNKFIPARKHKIFGDGFSLSSGNRQTLSLLTKFTKQPVFVDGIKSTTLINSYDEYKKTNSNFVAIGHPKALTRYSIKTISELMNKKGLTFNTIKEERAYFQSF